MVSVQSGKANWTGYMAGGRAVCMAGSLTVWRAVWQYGGQSASMAGSLSGSMAGGQYGSLPVWREGSLAVCQYGGRAVWQSASMAGGQSGSLPVWREGSLAVCQYGGRAVWQSASMAGGQSGSLPVWREGSLAVCQYASMAGGQSGSLPVCREGSLVEFSLFFFFFFIRFGTKYWNCVHYFGSLRCFFQLTLCICSARYVLFSYIVVTSKLTVYICYYWSIIPGVGGGGGGIFHPDIRVGVNHPPPYEWKVHCYLQSWGHDAYRRKIKYSTTRCSFYYKYIQNVVTKIVGLVRDGVNSRHE